MAGNVRDAIRAEITGTIDAFLFYVSEDCDCKKRDNQRILGVAVERSASDANVFHVKTHYDLFYFRSMCWCAGQGGGSVPLFLREDRFDHTSMPAGMQADNFAFAQHVEVTAARHTLFHYMAIYHPDVMEFLRKTLRPQSTAQPIDDVIGDLVPERVLRVEVHAQDIEPPSQAAYAVTKLQPGKDLAARRICAGKWLCCRPRGAAGTPGARRRGPRASRAQREQAGRAAPAASRAAPQRLCRGRHRELLGAAADATSNGVAKHGFPRLHDVARAGNAGHC